MCVDSSIINFAMFREERIVTYEKFVEQSEHLSQKRSDLQQQNAQLQKELDLLKYVPFSLSLSFLLFLF